MADDEDELERLARDLQANIASRSGHACRPMIERLAEFRDRLSIRELLQINAILRDVYVQGWHDGTTETLAFLEQPSGGFTPDDIIRRGSSDA